MKSSSGREIWIKS
ncbi:hypothetical protein E2320_007249, partial [Naja naja]